jgi:ATP-dependent DNA helicase RecG
LKRLGIDTVQDLLFHLPSRYEDRTRIAPIGTLRPGDVAAVHGSVDMVETKSGRRRSLLLRLSDGTGTLWVRFFHFTLAQQQALTRGVRLRCFGEARSGLHGLEMVHPEYQVMHCDEELRVEESLTPVYPTTAELRQTTLRRLNELAFEILRREGFEETLPPDTLAKYHFPPLAEALDYIHHPPPDAPLSLLEQGAHLSQRRLAFEELLSHHLSLQRLRATLLTHEAPRLRPPGKLGEAFLRALPFPLTAAQQRVIREIRADLTRTTPMLRLLQGDVGSGKTVVSALAALQAIESGYQAALMGPTELLADQHCRTFQQWFGPLSVPIVWISGKQNKASRRAALAEIAQGHPVLVVGTHALFQEEVVFPRLGLAIIDEQHRFGVHQRLALRDKGLDMGLTPHQLVMTATPIPRTLAMTAYADLDTSNIDELPPHRKPVNTVVIPDLRRDEIIERIAFACQAGRQVYWVCPLIEESDVLAGQAATKTAEELARNLPELRIGLIHGRLKGEEKERVMANFINGSIHLLVATTVIEVGVDVPNASLMIIENAERLGLAQLHQLRGRVGRGPTQSDCILLYRPPLTELAKARLQTLRQTTDGFQIAEKDLELRGPGELLGTRQAGLFRLRVADLARDRDLLPAVGEAAAILMKRYPDRIDRLIHRWLGDAVNYGRI